LVAEGAVLLVLWLGVRMVGIIVGYLTRIV